MTVTLNPAKLPIIYAHQSAVEQLLKDGIPKIKHDRYLLVLHAIYAQGYTRKLEHGTAVRLYSKLGEHFLSEDFYHARSYWLNAGFIRYNPRDYFADNGAGRSIAYSLIPEKLPGQWNHREVTNIPLAKKLLAARARGGAYTQFSSLVEDYQAQVLQGLEIKVEEAERIVRDYDYAPEIRYHKVYNEKFGKYTRRKVRDEATRNLIIEGRKAAGYASIHAISEGVERHQVITDRTSYRMHHPMTALPKKVRGTVRLNGRRIAGVDFSCLHPALLAWMMIEDGYTQQDVIELAELTRTGRYYKHLADLVSCSVKEAKHLNMLLMFGSNLLTASLSEYEAFRSEFPTVAAYMREAKCKRYNALAIKLQKAETRLMLHDEQSVMMRCIEKGIPAFTIHDCVVSSEVHLEKLLEIVQAVIAEFGIPCTCKTERW